jgi:hypothetical protein
LCENNFGGSGFSVRFGLWYCASVVGWINGPTLSCTASRPASQMPLSPASCGGKAYWRLSVSVWGTAVVNAFGASAARASAMPAWSSPAAPARIWWYSA